MGKGSRQRRDEREGGRGRVESASRFEIKCGTLRAGVVSAFIHVHPNIRIDASRRKRENPEREREREDDA